MSKNVQTAVFNLLDYMFTTVHIESLDADSIGKTFVSIMPKGAYSKSEERFILSLDVKIYLEEGEIEEEEIIDESKIFTSLSMQCTYTLQGNDGEIPEYFYVNSIAIAFPYVRAFLSSITVQANVRRIILPLLNLTELGNTLKEATSFTD